jgi:hypothetical protein
MQIGDALARAEVQKPAEGEHLHLRIVAARALVHRIRREDLRLALMRNVVAHARDLSARASGW